VTSKIDRTNPPRDLNLRSKFIRTCICKFNVSLNEARKAFKGGKYLMKHRRWFWDEASREHVVSWVRRTQRNNLLEFCVLFME